jgi:ParB-like chromosome segregation protein Spo0J
MTKKKPVPFDWIAPDLRPLALPIGELKQDLRNARTHDERNLQAIVRSLQQFGQLKPVVVNRATGIIEAGNATFEAAGRLGWTHLAAVRVKHNPAAAHGFAIADNRTAELADWDDAVLEDLLSRLQDESPDLYDDLLLDELRQRAKLESETTEVDEIPAKYQVIVNCRDEEDQREFFERMEGEGRQVSLLTM